MPEEQLPTTEPIINETPVTKIYPTQPDADGYYFEDESDEGAGIKTKVYENGNKIKTVVLPSSSKTVVVRELIGKDTKEVSRFMGGDQERYPMAIATVATTIDGTKQIFEYFEQLKMKDYTLILSMCKDLNF